jgi:hypothetical protein
MAFNVFGLRDQVVGEYQSYVKSFINILDPRLSDFVTKKLDQGRLWPDPVLQLNPALERTATLKALAREGVILPETARFFGEHLVLYRHLEEALRIARQRQHYIVSTGTGSGRRLTYLLPIVEHIFRDDPKNSSVRALIVYPMNALINSPRIAIAASGKPQRLHPADCASVAWLLDALLGKRTEEGVLLQFNAVIGAMMKKRIRALTNRSKTGN